MLEPYDANVVIESGGRHRRSLRGRNVDLFFFEVVLLCQSNSKCVGPKMGGSTVSGERVACFFLFFITIRGIFCLLGIALLEPSHPSIVWYSAVGVAVSSIVRLSSSRVALSVSMIVVPSLFVV